MGITSVKEFLPLQPGDVPATSADTSALEAWTGFKPNTSVKEGVARFVTWYREFTQHDPFPETNSCTVAVIGLGYVGLPLAVEFAKPNFAAARVLLCAVR